MTTPLRILHCLRAPVGGLFRHVLDLAGEQVRLGHAVGMIADRNATDALTAGRLGAIAPKLGLGLELVAMSRHPGVGDLVAARSVYAHARSLDLDVLHGHGAKGGAYARLAARALKAGGARTAAIYTPHGGSLHYKPGTAAGTAFIAAEKILARMTDGLIFESDYTRRIYAARVGLGATPVRVVPNGLGPEDFFVHVPAPDAADFLFIGELRAIKGVDVLLKALAMVNEVRPARAVIVGAGGDGRELKRLADQLGLTDRVAFPGAMPARAAFPLGRALVVPSRAESLPYVVLEAAAAGMPLVATDVGGIPEIVAGTDTALVPADDVNALSAALGTLLAEPEAARARAERLKARVAERFTIAAMTAGVLELYAAARQR